MIVIINGPLGIGKSEASWQLLYRLPRAVMLDMDHIAAFHPFDYYCQEHLDYAYSTAGILVEHHVRHGFSDFVINWVFESADQLKRLEKEIAPFGLPIYAFRLWCDTDEIARRIRTRNRNDIDREIARSRELVAILDAAAKTGDIGTVLDTTSLTLEETVDKIWDHIQTGCVGPDDL
jgi:deoxyadenosine/deoxycytidine kinase